MKKVLFFIFVILFSVGIYLAWYVLFYYANRLGDNPSLFSQEDKTYHNALIKALNKAYYSLMEGLEKRLNAIENAEWL